MDEPTTPLVFANKIILQMIQHSMSDDMLVEPRDYSTIRLAFRKAGGSWSQFSNGDTAQFELLRSIIMTWGQLPGRQLISEQVV